MTRRRKRRQAVQRHAAAPMFVISGLPKALHRDAIDRLKEHLPSAIVQGLPGPTKDGGLYSTEYVAQLTLSVGSFAIRRRTNGNAQPAPASITLLYVPAPDEENLLAQFDFAVMPFPLSMLAKWDKNGKQLRHDRPTVELTLKAAVSNSGVARANLATVAKRLNYKSDNEGMLLPPGNFMTQAGNLHETFRGFRRSERLWTDRMNDLGPSPLTNDDVPKRVQRKQTRRVFVDARGIAFFIAHPTAYDGAAREIEENEHPEKVLLALRALYRFGGALERGIHHDVQRSNGQSLGGATFECCVKRKISSDADYANVYPNEFVRVKKYKAME